MAPIVQYSKTPAFLLVADIWKSQSGEAQSLSVDRKRAMEYLYRVNFLWINVTCNGGNKCDHMLTTKTGFGDVEHMAPIVQYSKTPAFWDKPCPVLGSSYPTWW